MGGFQGQERWREGVQEVEGFGGVGGSRARRGGGRGGGV